MKIRINGNSVRLRLSPEEVKALVEKNCVEDECQFVTNKLIYRVVRSDKEEICATYEEAAISIFIPKEQLTNWQINDKVGFEHTTREGLFILVEKDFKCMQPRKHEKEDHLYPNPLANK